MIHRLTRFFIPTLAIAALVMLASCSDDNADDTPSATNTPAAAATRPEVTPEIPFAGACVNSGEKTFSAAPPRIIDTNMTYVATIKTDKGDIVLQLDNRHAVTTNNFVFLACKGYYDGLTFHRVEADFVIQGGDPEGNGQGGPGYTIPGEFEGSVFDRGVIGMARTGDPNSAGSQFYIMIGDAGHNLDGAYADFGHVTSGQDVAEQIAIGDSINEITITEQ